MPSVLVLTTSYPSPRSAVAGTFVREHVASLPPAWKALVLHLERSPDVRRLVVEQSADDVAEIVRVRFPERPTVVSYAGLAAAGAVGFRAVRRLGFEPDLLHAHFFIAGFPAVRIGRRRRLPVVVTEHWTAFLPEDPQRLSRPLAWAAGYTFARAALVLPVSEPLRQALAARGVSTPMRVVPNAVDLELFHAPPPRTEPPTRLALVGLLTGQKGVDVLLEALGTLRERRPELHLDVVGDGEERGEYERLAARLELEAAVTFHGIQPKARIADLLRAADVYVLASRFENNPVALIEALASGLPSVATGVGGVPEMVGDDGVLVRPGDASALAAGLEQVLGSYERYDRGAIAARAAARWSREAVGAALDDAYASVLG